MDTLWSFITRDLSAMHVSETSGVAWQSCYHWDTLPLDQ